MKSRTEDVVARALEEVAKARALRERMARAREEKFARIPARQSVDVLARQKPALAESKH
jgi:hypothetical protein